METCLKTDFAQIFSRCPKNLSYPKFGGGGGGGGGGAPPAAPLVPPPARTPMLSVLISILRVFFLLCKSLSVTILFFSVIFT